jgi:hypothetical protein
MRRLILSVALVGLGVGGGYVLGSQRAQPQSPAVARDRAERAPIVVADRGLSEAELRRVVKEELAAGGQAGGQPGGQGEGSAREPAKPAPAASPAVLDDGMRRVHQAITKRQWTRDDAIALSRTLEAASPEQRAAILRTLVPALNRGEIKLTYRGDLF